MVKKGVRVRIWMLALIKPNRDQVCARAGFSLIEVLVVLAIFALSSAIIMPSMARMLDQTTAHAVFFEFQRQVSDARREVNRTGEPIIIIDPSLTDQLEEGERVLSLRAPWRYTLAPKLDITEGGICNPVSANLVLDERVVMSLRSSEGDCRFEQIHAVKKG